MALESFKGMNYELEGLYGEADVGKRLRVWRDFAERTGGEYRENHGLVSRIIVTVDDVAVTASTRGAESLFGAKTILADLPAFRMTRVGYFAATWAWLGRSADVVRSPSGTAFRVVSSQLETVLELLQDVDLDAIAAARTPDIWHNKGVIRLWRRGAIIVDGALERGAQAASELAHMGVAALLDVHHAIEDSDWSWTPPSVELERGDQLLRISCASRDGRRMMVVGGSSRSDLSHYEVPVRDGVPASAAAGLSSSTIARLHRARAHTIRHDATGFELHLPSRATVEQVRAAVDVVTEFHRPSTSIFR